MTNSAQQHGHIGPKRPRRVNANFIERRRVHQLNERFDQLRQLLPPTGEKQSKVVVLTRCSELIRCQQQVIRDLLLQLDQQQSMWTSTTAFKAFDYVLPNSRSKSDFCPTSVLSRAPPYGHSSEAESTNLSQATPATSSSRSSDNRFLSGQESEENADVAGAAGMPVGSPPASDKSVAETENEHAHTPGGGDMDLTSSPSKMFSYGPISASNSSGSLSQASSSAETERMFAPQVSAASALIQLSASKSAAANQASPRGKEAWSFVHHHIRSPSKDFSLYRRNLMPEFNSAVTSTPTRQAAPSLPLSRSYLGWLPGGCQYSPVKPPLVQPMVPGMMSCSYPYDPAMYNYLASNLMSSTHNESGH